MIKTKYDLSKSFIAKRYVQNKISFYEMVKLLGYKEAKKISDYIKIAKHSIITCLK